GATCPCPLSLHDALPICRPRCFLWEHRELFVPYRRRRSAPTASPSVRPTGNPSRRMRRIFPCFTRFGSSSTVRYSRIARDSTSRSEEHTSELQSRENLVC